MHGILRGRLRLADVKVVELGPQQKCEPRTHLLPLCLEPPFPCPFLHPGDRGAVIS